MVKAAWASRGRRGRTFLLLLAGTAAIAAARETPIRPGIVLGESMAPAFHSGQVFLMRRLGARPQLHRGDAVLVRVGGETYLKRIYALAGEPVWGVDSSEVEGYPDWPIQASEAARIRKVIRRLGGDSRVVELRVPQGHVFVVGDAEARSYDSRHFGPVPTSAVQGRVVVSDVSKLLHFWRPKGATGVARASETRR